jgi:hypothetical protein
MNIETQTRSILKHLKAGKSITPLTALTRFGCMRLSARIYDIRNMGVSIDRQLIRVNGKRVAKYFLKVAK